MIIHDERGVLTQDALVELNNHVNEMSGGTPSYPKCCSSPDIGSASLIAFPGVVTNPKMGKSVVATKGTAVISISCRRCARVVAFYTLDKIFPEWSRQHGTK